MTIFFIAEMFMGNVCFSYSIISGDLGLFFLVSKISFISVCFAVARLKKLPCFILLENVKGFETSCARLEFAQFGAT